MSAPRQAAQGLGEPGRNQLARQFLIMFISGTLVPLGILSVLVLGAITHELEAQSEQRLHQASRATGMALIGRLTELERELRGAARGGLPDIASIEERFLAIGQLQTNGAPRWLRGKGIDTGRTLRGFADLAAGGSALVTNERGIFMAVRVEEASLPFVGMLQPAHLLRAARNTIPPDGQFCLTTALARVLGCSDGLTLPSRPPFDSASGPIEFSSGGDSLRGQYWSLFLKARFDSEPWVMILVEPEAAIRAPLSEFRMLFALALGLAFLLVLLVNLQQIRRRLAPLQALIAGTREVAAGNFAVRAPIDGTNELGELAHSFNVMAGALDLHFKTQQEILEFDRHLIAAADEASIASYLARHLLALTPADRGTVGIDRTDADSLCLASLGTDGVLQTTVLHDPTKLRAFLVEHPDVEMLPTGMLPPELGPHFSAQMLAWFPLVANQQPAGFALLRFERDPGGLEALASAQQLVARASMALGNLRTIEANRLLTHYDALTGLPNRVLFKERLNQALRRIGPTSTPLAVLITGLDGFQGINEEQGHDVGDRVLQIVSARLAEEFGEGAVSRLGGDEFGILLDAPDGKAGASARAERWAERLAVPFEIDDRTVRLSTSTGIAVAPEDGKTAEALISGSDAALHAAKQAGAGGDIQLFTAAMNERARARTELIEALREAIDREEFRVYYQPVIDVQTRSIASAEALIRWQRPGHGLVGPATFIDIAEENGLEVGMGAWVMAQTCRDIASWLAEGLEAPRVAVNLSARQLQDTGLRAQVLDALAPASLPPHYLGFELTERSLMDGAVMENLERLRRLGIRLAVDDFGTGYSSLGYLQKFQLDVLKIDKSFIQHLPGNEQAATITRACIAMAHGLGMEVIAEGLETEAQFGFLRQCGCDQVQGYLFSKPVPADAFVKLLREDAG